MRRILSDKELYQFGAGRSPSALFKERREGLHPPSVKLGNKNGTFEDEAEVKQMYLDKVRGDKKLTAALKQWLKNKKLNGCNPFNPPGYQEWLAFAADLRGADSDQPSKQPNKAKK